MVTAYRKLFFSPGFLLWEVALSFFRFCVDSVVVVSGVDGTGHIPVLGGQGNFLCRIQVLQQDVPAVAFQRNGPGNCRVSHHNILIGGGQLQGLQGCLRHLQYDCPRMFRRLPANIIQPAFIGNPLYFQGVLRGLSQVIIFLGVFIEDYMHLLIR